MQFPLTIIEPGIGQWRSADIDADELPTDLRFHDDIAVSAQEAVFDARVTRIDRNLDMAFLDLGEGYTGALNFRRARLLKKGKVTHIGECVQEGQLLRVQVVSEPSLMDDKALQVTPRPRLMGRYVVVETGAPRLNLSKDLTARRTKELKELLAPHVDGAAVIVRSRAQTVDSEIVLSEAKQLMAAVTQPMDDIGLVHSWSPAEKALLACQDGDTPIYVDRGTDFAALKALAAGKWPEMADRLAPYPAGDSAFETLGVNEAVDDALADQINLPSGGWISITPTPAMTVVDVNMGSALQHMSAGEAKLVVNMEATLALAHHLRFQDIGGLIVVDYINMSAKGSTRELMQLIERTFREDSVPVQHTGISAFGLVEFTRKRAGLSLRDRLQRHRAPVERTAAQGLGLLRKAARIGQSNQVGNLLLQAPQPVLDWLSATPSFIDMLASETSRTVSLVVHKKTDAVIQS